ncbi:MAG: gliding motility protein GldL [Saprospiraceae bacterium]|nr:gliding motility protein GldL [Saprospiraceae bacterium]MBK7810661.1 gliding motility protein GldL [Saprospiraceae bacterium]MBK9631451.1 gliding motility protein GldL [Saprospiraceae bacterium]
MAIYKTDWFKYLKNFMIGVGASIVMIGALFKILSMEGGDVMLTAGLVTEAILFLVLGILPPEKDYYWEKLYPGLDDYHARITPLTEGPVKSGPRPLNAEIVEGQLGGMLGELQNMSKSLGSLKALQEVDFSKTGDQIKAMGNFYSKMNEAITEMSASVEDTKKYKDQVAALNKNLSSLNGVYGNILGAYKTMGGTN